MSGYRVSTHRAPCRGGLNRKSSPIWQVEIRTAQGLGGENRITHSTLRGGVIWANEDPQKSAILGSRQVHNRAAKAAPAAQLALASALVV